MVITAIFVLHLIESLYIQYIIIFVLLQELRNGFIELDIFSNYFGMRITFCRYYIHNVQHAILPLFKKPAVINLTRSSSVNFESTVLC